MRAFGLVIIVALFSCTKQTPRYSQTILENDILNSSFLERIPVPEKALLAGYLFAYGNACTQQIKSNKCLILEQLKIEDECSKNHTSFLKQWFSEDSMLKSKLIRCPVLPIDGAIQNTFKAIRLIREGDTLTISFHIVGTNIAQEKNWDIQHTKRYLIEKSKFIPLE